MADPRNVLLMFRREGALVGSVFLQNRGDRAYLGMFTVAPESQAAGIGKAALSAIEDWLRANWRIPLVEMTVISRRRELVEWYERRGYRDTGRREPFPYGEPRVGLPRFPDLEMIVLQKHL